MTDEAWQTSPRSAASYLRRTHEQNERATSRGLNKLLSEQQWERGEERTITFTIPGPEEETKVTIDYDHFFDHNFRRVYDSPLVLERTIPLRSYRCIKNITLQNGSNTFDLREAVGHDMSVYIYTNDIHPAPVIVKRGGHVSTEFNIMFIFNDIRTIAGIRTLLHEVGHVVKRRKNEGEKKDQPLSTRARGKIAGILSRKVRKARKINEERSAHAFALNTLRHFVDRETLSKVHLQSHRSLATYHEVLNTQQY